ncbi:MAG: asparagine synthase (glutamine-hydrolyzing) [Acutalibacteraceae bacterium]
MCGIAGWWNYDGNISVNDGVINKMSLTLKDRGPDESGSYINNNIILLQRRLSVIDPEHGKQPMIRMINKKHYVIVYNGELYNTEDLRKELKSKGYKFEERSDTEVLLTAYAHWGENCVEHLNGIFAFAVYNEENEELFLARDRIGVKPLFYYEYNGGIIFGSEIKTLLANPIVEPIVDEQGMYEVFFIGPARTPGHTPFKNVFDLLPGECMKIKKKKCYKKTYFSLKAAKHSMDVSDSIDYLRFLLTDSIERQLISDVPLCCFLSGGLDSSVICAVAANYYKKNKKGMLPTYSVDYTDNQKFFQKSIFQPNDDKEYIQIMSKNIGSFHREVILDNLTLANALYDAVNARDIPSMADIDSSMLLFCSHVKNDYTVALSGECADELFGGYPWYHNKDILFEECFPWSRSVEIRKSVLKKGFLPRGSEYAHQRYLDTVKNVDTLDGDSPYNNRMREMFALNFYWFMQTLLDRKDRMSMYSGLEIRVPFCDYRIVEFAYNLPWEIKSLNGREKGIIRTAMSDILPFDIAWRKKSPYPKTQNPEYFNIVAERTSKILNDKSSPINEFIDRTGVEAIIENPDKISSPWYGQLMKAPQILAYIIQVDYWLKKYNVKLDL